MNKTLASPAWQYQSTSLASPASISNTRSQHLLHHLQQALATRKLQESDQNTNLVAAWRDAQRKGQPPSQLPPFNTSKKYITDPQGSTVMVLAVSFSLPRGIARRFQAQSARPPSCWVPDMEGGHALGWVRMPARLGRPGFLHSE